jgi:hypothetical protein
MGFGNLIISCFNITEIFNHRLCLWDLYAKLIISCVKIGEIFDHRLCLWDLYAKLIISCVNITDFFDHRLCLCDLYGKPITFTEFLGFWTLPIVGNFYILEYTRTPITTRIPDDGQSPEIQ